MKKIILAVILTVAITSLVSGVEHQKRGPDLTIREKWTFTKSEVKEILIQYLLNKGVTIQNVNEARLYFRTYDEDSVELSVVYEIVKPPQPPDSEKKGVEN